jgi:hypothetical protein
MLNQELNVPARKLCCFFNLIGKVSVVDTIKLETMWPKSGTLNFWDRGSMVQQQVCLDKNRAQ